MNCLVTAVSAVFLKCLLLLLKMTQHFYSYVSCFLFDNVLVDLQQRLLCTFFDAMRF